MLKNQPAKKRTSIKQQNPSNDSGSRPSRKDNPQVSFKETAVISPPGSATGASDLSSSVKRHSSVAVAGIPPMSGAHTVSSTHTSP